MEYPCPVKGCKFKCEGEKVLVSHMKKEHPEEKAIIIGMKMVRLR